MLHAGWRGPPRAPVVAALALAAALVACEAAPPSGAPAAPPPAATGTPGAGTPGGPDGQGFYVSDRTAAARRLPELRAQGRTAEAEAVARLAGAPSAHWLVGGDDRTAVEELSRAATAAGRTALFVAYDIPQRDCGSFAAGGAPDAASYRAWVDALSAGLADRRAWVVLEPDAVPHALDGCGPKGVDAAERYALLAYAVAELKRHPRVRVYLDAGNAGWAQDRTALVDALNRSGIGQADGFAVNVANFYGTEQSAAYGAGLSAALGGKHFVIDTSRNGNGPLGSGAWCNPPGRAVGETPTERTGRPGVDAYLWVKIPGESDGDCGRGEPGAGQFWLDYAVGLATR
ncbi:glycoside hydrolase family 6 protein [Kitasatospora indigofera]|uniref:glycoside hydrolase family 6 protein n=1 Tax=Kitasatospora indigofera TaxID=67307 RepID=UPI0036400BC9